MTTTPKTTNDAGYYSIIMPSGEIRRCHCSFYSYRGRPQVIVTLTNDPLVGNCNQNQVWTKEYFDSVLVD